MLEIDCKEFNGDRDFLVRFLREKLRTDVQIGWNKLRIGPGEHPSGQPSMQEVRDVVKRALHHMGMDEYHVVSTDGALSIRQRKGHRPHVGKKGSAPSVRQTVPYFFPG